MYELTLKTFVTLFFFQRLNDWSFNVYTLSEYGNGQPIKYLGYDLLNRYRIFQKFKVSCINTYCNSFVNYL